MDERTTINVKSVDAEAWVLARKHAAQRGLAMGEWLSAAIRTQAAVEQGDRILPPSGPSLEVMEAALAALTPVLASLGPVPSARYLADSYARRMMGLPAASSVKPGPSASERLRYWNRRRFRLRKQRPLRHRRSASTIGSTRSIGAQRPRPTSTAWRPDSLLHDGMTALRPPF